MTGLKMQALGPPLMLASFFVPYLTYKGFLSLLRRFGLTLPDPLAAPTPTVGFWLIMGTWLLVCVLAIVSAYRRLGYVRLKPANARDKTLQVIHRIEKQRGWCFEVGVFVIHCGDSFWRETVQLCLTYASVVVIDVTELSENLIWELETAFKLMAPESIVLACGVEEGGPRELPSQVREQLPSGPHVRDLNSVRTFFYPLIRKPMKYPKGNRTALITELKSLLDSGISYSSSAHRNGDGTNPN